MHVRLFEPYLQRNFISVSCCRSKKRIFMQFFVHFIFLNYWKRESYDETKRGNNNNCKGTITFHNKMYELPLLLSQFPSPFLFLSPSLPLPLSTFLSLYSTHCILSSLFSPLSLYFHRYNFILTAITLFDCYRII